MDRDYAELRAKVAGLEGHVNTALAKIETGLDGPGRETQAGFVQLGKVIAERDAEASKRENRLVNRMTILLLGGLAIAVAALRLI